MHQLTIAGLASILVRAGRAPTTRSGVDTALLFQMLPTLREPHAAS